MRTHYRNLEKNNYTCLFVLLLCVLGTPCFAGVNLPWSTTYDCADWDNGDTINCDGLGSAGGWSCYGNYEQITSAANNPNGGGGKGQRHWYGDGTNSGSGGSSVEFSAQPEIWIRWYMRYPLGFTWSTSYGNAPHYDKILLTFAGGEKRQIKLEGGGIGLGGGTVPTPTSGGQGWANINGGATGDGQFHCYEVHIVAETGVNNGTFEVWIDGVQVLSDTSADFGSSAGIDSIIIGSNQESPDNGGVVAVDYDDIAISNTGYIGLLGGGGGLDVTPAVRSNGSPSGSLAFGTTQTVISLDTNEGATCKYATTPGTVYNNMTNTFSTTGGTSHSQLITGLLEGNSYTYYVRCQDSSSNVNNDDYSVSFSVEQAAGGQNIELFTEEFENASFSSRGWYDNIAIEIVSNEFAPANGSTASARFHWDVNDTQPDSGASMRKKFTATDSFSVEYWVKYSSNWQGSGLSYHPHEFYILSDQDTDYNSLAYGYLSAYIEQNALKPRLIVKDSANINTSQGVPPIDLTSITEDRSANGCNGEQDGYSTDCYQSSGVWINGKEFISGSPLISLDTWHKVAAYFKLNTVAGSTTNADGIVQYWLDGSLVLDYQNVIMRTSAQPDIKFNQFVIAPYIGPGSPVDQTMWIDNLTVATERAYVNVPPAKPSGVHIP